MDAKLTDQEMLELELPEMNEQDQAYWLSQSEEERDITRHFANGGVVKIWQGKSTIIKDK